MKAPEIVDLAIFIHVGRPRPPEFRPAGVVNHEILCRRREWVVVIGPGDRIEQAFAQPIVEMKLGDQRGERRAAGQVGRAADAIGKHRRKARQRRAELCPSRHRTNETGGLLRRIAGKAEAVGIEIARTHRGHDDGGQRPLGPAGFPVRIEWHRQDEDCDTQDPQPHRGARRPDGPRIYRPRTREFSSAVALLITLHVSRSRSEEARLNRCSLSMIPRFSSPDERSQTGSNGWDVSSPSQLSMT